MIAEAVASGKSGEVVVTGYFKGSGTYCGDLHASQGGTDIFVVKYRADGTCQWSRSFGSKSDDRAYAVAMDSSGFIYLTGYVGGDFEFGCAQHPTKPIVPWPLFVLKMDGAGKCLWCQVLGLEYSADGRGRSLAVNSKDEVIVTGTAFGKVGAGNTYTICSHALSVFLAKILPSGKLSWAKCLGAALGNQSNAVAISKNDDILCGGAYYDSPSELGGKQLPNSGEWDAAIARYTTDGVHLWSKGLGGPGGEIVQDLVGDEQGGVVAIGSFAGKTSLGGPTLASSGIQDQNVLVAKYDAQGGHVWSKGYGGSRQDTGRSIALTTNGQIVLFGGYAGPVSFGKGPLPSYKGLQRLFLVGLEPSGATAWSVGIGGDYAKHGTYDTTPGGLAMSGSSGLVALADYSGTLVVGSGLLTCKDTRSIALLKYSLPPN